MRLRLLSVAILAICMPVLGSCTDSTSTPNPGISTPSPLAASGCVHLIPHDMSITPTVEPYRDPIRFSITPTGVAPTYEDFWSTLQRLEAQRAEADKDGSNVEKYREADKELKDFWSNLDGKRVEGWQAWVVRAGADLQYSSGPYSDAVELLNNPSAAFLYMENPYSIPSPRKTPFDTRSRPPTLLITPGGADSGQVLCPGQKVQVSGMLQSYRAKYGEHGLIISSATVVPVDNASSPAVPSDLQGMMMRFERTDCFVWCPSYEVTLYGDGSMIFEGYNTKVLGYKMSNIPEGKLRQLLAEFDKINYFSFPGCFDDNPDLPRQEISLTLNGKSHTVHNGCQYSNTPQDLIQLEDKIDEILNTEQWVQ